MKARFFALAALVLGMVSCQQDFDAAPQVGGEVDFQLKVDAVELATRAGDIDGDTQEGYDSAYGAIDYLSEADWSKYDLRYSLEVYDKADDYAGATPIKDRMVQIVDKYQPVMFDLRLVPNRDYHFVVFADFVPNGASSKANTDVQRELGLRHNIGENLGQITIKEDAINDEIADAYFATKDIRIENSAAQDILLKRPYGKVRVVATDLNELNLNVTPGKVKVEYTAKHPLAFNAVTGEVDSEYKTCTYECAYDKTISKEKGGLQNHFYNIGLDAKTATNANGVERHTHMTLFTDYILAEKEGQTPYHFTMTVWDKNNLVIKETHFNTDIPVARNMLTTVVGNVLTTATEINVSIDDNFATKYTLTMWDGKSVKPVAENNGVYEIYEAAELAWFAKQVNEGNKFSGKTVKLCKDIHLNGERWTPIGATGKFEGTFDGQDNVIEGLFVEVTDKTPAGLFANAKYVKNLKVCHAEVYGHYKAGVIVGNGLCSRIDNCHVENAVVTIVPLNKDDANHAGGIVGYLSAENEAWVKDCSVKNSTISAYRDVAAIAGTANQAAVVTGNDAENVVVIADHRPEYKEVKEAKAGKVAGRIHANAVLENNTDTDVVIKLYNVTDADLQTVINNAKEGDTVCVAGEYGKFPSVGKNMTIDATGATFKGNSKLNINGTTVIGATFSNPSGNAVDQTINGIFKSCTFFGSNAIRYGYTGPVCEFEDCVFDGAVYGCHFDGNEGGNELSFTRCTFSGFNALGAKIPTVTLNKCVFEANGRSGYNGINLWGNSYVNNTTFKFDGRASSQWIGLSNMDGGKEYVFDGCKVLDANNEERPSLLPYFNALKVGKFVTVDGVEYEYLGNSRFAANGKVYVYNLTGLKAAVANAEANVEVVLCADINGDVTVGQNADVNVTIDGANFNYGGVIVVDGKSATYTTAGLTIKNLNFNAETISADACIRLGDGNNATRYTCNVTVEGCTFDVPGAVGVKSYTGGDKNLTIKGCTAAANTHSLLQAAGIDGILVEGCTVNSKNGLNFNQSDNIVIDSTAADVRGYAVRFGASSGDGEAAETYTIQNSTLKSACAETGDAVIVLRGTAAKATLNLINTTINGKPQFINNTDAKVYVDGAIVVSNADEIAAALTADKANVGVVLANDIDLPISKLGQQTGGSGEYKLGGEQTENISIDLNGYKLNITTTYWSGIGAKNADALFTIKNGTMTSSQSTGTWNSYDLTFANCNYVIEDVVFEKAIAFAATGKSASLKNVTINETHDYYAMWISAEGQEVKIDGLTINATAGRGIKIDEQYVDAPAKVTLNVKNATFNTAKKAAILVKSVEGADITVSNIDIANVVADTTNAVWVDEDAAAYFDLVTVNGATKKQE